jgi:hypothetical protein
MAWVLRHPNAGTRTHREAVSAVRWPRGLGLIGLAALLVSAWGGIVPYVGPVFGYSSNGAPAWQWTFQHAMLYLVPGAVGAVVSLAVLSRAGGGRGLARASLGLLGLILGACGAWFVIGPVTWPIWHPAAVVFGHGTNPTARFVNQIGYNLGVGVVLAALGGMVMKASTGEREIRRSMVSADGVDYGAGRRGDRTLADPAYSDATMSGAGQPVPAEDRTVVAGERPAMSGRQGMEERPAAGTTAEGASPTTVPVVGEDASRGSTVPGTTPGGTGERL